MVYDLRFMRKRKGFTLIESMVLVVIFAIAVMTFYKSYILMMEYSLETKHRVASVEFASAELEVLRNTPYEDIYLDSGTTPSPPTGSVIGASAGTGLSYSKIVTVNGTTHRVLTEIYYVDDADDGLGTSNDDNINDYKRINITVLWNEGMTDITDTKHSIQLSSIFVPPSGNESVVENGAISINVVDSSGSAVDGATVEVDDLVGSPANDFSGTTDANGNVLFDDVPPSMNAYMITVSKTGRENVLTMSKYPTTSYYPIYTHASVLSGTITTLTIVQDVAPDIDITLKDPFGSEISSIGFALTGGRVLGVDTAGDPVYVNTDLNTSLATTSDANGVFSFDSVGSYVASVGKYFAKIDSVTGYIDEGSGSQTDYYLWKFYPGSDTEQNAVEVSNNTATHSSDMILLDDAINSVFVSVTDSLTTEAYHCANVRLTDSSSYDESQQTDIHGKTYFPVSANVNDELTSGEDYDITISAPECVDDCTGDCDNDCIENGCIDGCVIYESDCTSYGYANVTDSTSAQDVSGLMFADIELAQ